MNLLEFEDKLGKKVSEITTDDLMEIMNPEKDPEFLIALSDPETGLTISEAVLETNPNDEVKREFAPLKYHHLLYSSQSKLSQMFAQKDKTELLKSIKEFINSATPLGKLSAYLVCLTTIEDFDFSEYAEDIQKTVRDTEEILFNLDIERGFPIICDLIDMLYQIQQEYYEKFNIDLIGEDAEKLNEFVQKVSVFSEETFKNVKDELDEKLPQDIRPEDIGIIDVTNLETKEKEE